MKMKHYAAIPTAMLAALSIFSSCQKETDNSTTPASPLMNVISSDTTLSYFNLAIIGANDQQIFSSLDSVTVFAPTNDAFRTAGISVGSITALTPAMLDSLIRYHYATGSINAGSSTYIAYNSLLGPALYGSTDGTNIYFNGAIALKQDPATTGTATLYKLNLPLQIPAASLTAFLAGDASLSLFAEALQRTGLGTSLGTGGWNTILVPDNNAFNAAGYPDIASIDNKGIDTLTNLISYHILSGQYFTNNFNQATVGSTEGGTIAITTGVLPQFTGNNNTAAASITSANKIAGTNIIVHKINTVLLP